MTTQKTFTKMIVAASVAVVIALASISFSAKATQDAGSVAYCWGTFHTSQTGIELCDGTANNCTHPCVIVAPTTPIIVAEN